MRPRSRSWRSKSARVLSTHRIVSAKVATFAHDGAKRLTGITKGTLTETQTYDRDGNVTSEARSFPSVSGDPGTGTQSFTYDALNRVLTSTGLASGTRSYAYDRDGNRTSKTEGGVTFSYVFDRTDELLSVQKTGGSSQSFTYDAYGNLTGNAESAVAVTTMTYDLGDKLTGIDAAGTTNDATFTFDALGRFRTRVLAGSTDTYSYLGSGETVLRIANSVAGTTDSPVSPEGDRLGVKVGSTLNWFVPDAHGTIAGSLDATEATVVNAIRYDAYGQKIGSGGAGGTPVGHDAWKYQGRLDISPSGLGTPLYDMSARFYAPGLGAFSQLDTVMGSAQNPLSMNRFLYAHANPATLIDPTGHCAMDMLLTCGASASAPAPSRPRTYDEGPAQSANPTAATGTGDAPTTPTTKYPATKTPTTKSPTTEAPTWVRDDWAIDKQTTPGIRPPIDLSPRLGGPCLAGAANFPTVFGGQACIVRISTTSCLVTPHWY